MKQNNTIFFKYKLQLQYWQRTWICVPHLKHSYEYYSSSNTFNIKFLELDWFKVVIMVYVFRVLREAGEFSLAFATVYKF